MCHDPLNEPIFCGGSGFSGTQAGLILATAVFLPISALPDEQLFSWGWRVPFWLSLVVVVVGYIIRRTLAETPAFEQEKREGEIPQLPLAILFKSYTSDVLRIVFAALVSVVSTIFGLYTLSYAVNTIGLPRPTMLWVLILGNVIALAAIPAWAMVADRVGRKPIFILGALGSAVVAWPYLSAGRTRRTSRAATTSGPRTGTTLRPHPRSGRESRSRASSSRYRPATPRSGGKPTRRRAAAAASTPAPPGFACCRGGRWRSPRRTRRKRAPAAAPVRGLADGRKGHQAGGEGHDLAARERGRLHSAHSE